MEDISNKLSAIHLALGLLGRLLWEHPARALIYFQRARLRASLFQFYEATAATLTGLALQARNQSATPNAGSQADK